MKLNKAALLVAMVVAMAAVFTSCSSGDDDSSTANSPVYAAALVGTWVTTTADADNLYYKVIFAANGTYSLFEGASASVLTTSVSAGTFVASATTITITNTFGTFYPIYSISGSTLTMDGDVYTKQ